MVPSKIYDKWDNFDFRKVNFPFRNGGVPYSPYYGVDISHFFHFARVCSNVDDSN